MLAKTKSAKLSAKAGFSVIDKSDLFSERAKGITKASQEFGLSAAATAAVMKKFHWDLSAARKKYRECDDDPFRFSKEMNVVPDLTVSRAITPGIWVAFFQECQQ